MDTLAYHPVITHALAYSSTVVGRDKIYRAIQYWSRFYAWYLHRKGYSNESIEPWAALKSHLGTARKLMRIGKNIEHLKAAAIGIKDQSLKNDILRYLGVLRQLGYGGYLTLDVASWAYSVKFITLNNPKKVAEDANRLWAVGLIASIVAGLYKLHINLATAKEIAAGEKTGPNNIQVRRLQSDRSAIFYQLIQDSMDITIPGSALSYLKLDDGLVGLAGLISSFMGARTQWKKVAPKTKAT